MFLSQQKMKTKLSRTEAYQAEIIRVEETQAEATRAEATREEATRAEATQKEANRLEATRLQAFKAPVTLIFFLHHLIKIPRNATAFYYKKHCSSFKLTTNYSMLCLTII